MAENIIKLQNCGLDVKLACTNEIIVSVQIVKYKIFAKKRIQYPNIEFAIIAH